MKDLLDKLSSYNIFNYLLPGTLFAVLSKETTRHSFLQGDVVVGVFVYYFIGLVVSRLGSLIIEPSLKKTRFLKFAEYNKFVSAVKEDPKIETLSEVNNMYRTICSVFIILFLLRMTELLGGIWPAIDEYSVHMLMASLFIIFLFSYRKQTEYIVKRILHAEAKK